MALLEPLRHDISIPLILGLAALATGCWKTDYAEVPETALVFEPTDIADVPEGWQITPIEVDLECPNGEPAQFYFVYPTELAAEGAALKAAVIYHSGAFDFVYAPIAEAPLEGTHFADPSRLDNGWAIRHIFVTLGMLPNSTETETYTGALAVALAEQDIAMLFATNCWGDMWHNRSGTSDNDFPADLFARNGRTAAEWGYQFLADPTFAQTLGVELPAVIQLDSVYAIGLGEGGRAVGELLSVDGDFDGIPDHTVAGALVDSSPDDLGVFYRDPSLHGNTIAGLNRIFPGGANEADDASLFNVDLPERFGYLYSTSDPVVPWEAHIAISSRLMQESTAWEYVGTEASHLLLDEDLQLARDAVDYLLNGGMPTSGNGVPVGEDGE